jgi:uncharacterized protein
MKTQARTLSVLLQRDRTEPRRLPARLHASARVLIAVFALTGAHCGTDAPKENFGRPRPNDPSPPKPQRDGGESRDAAPNDGASQSDTDAARRSDAAPVKPSDRDADAADSSLPDGGPSDAAAPPDPIRTACGEPPVTTGTFSRERLRAASADCAMYRYCAFQHTARALEDSVTSWQADRSDAKRNAARDTWQKAMAQWSLAELFQFGPAASAAMNAGKDTYEGQGLRDRIYGWPASARCRVEEEVVDRTTNLANVLVSGRGLYAIEYALFHAGDDTECAAGSQVADAWSALSADERDARKAAYALAVARDVRAQAEALVNAWDPGQGNFEQTFVSAGGKYPNEQEALNVLGWALIYIEKEVKDWKLGIPAGHTMDPPVSGPEAPFARTATDNIRANLRGFRQLFEGCGDDGEGLGFDDWLNDAGHAELATELIAAWRGAQKAVDEMPPLHAASQPELDAAYQALRQLTTLLKSDLFGTGSPLNLKLPASVEGDTD